MPIAERLHLPGSIARARATPGAVSGALSNASPPRGVTRITRNIDIDGRTADPDTRHAPIRIREVTPRYFDTFRIPLVRGRTFKGADRDGEPAVVLTESAERMLFAGERALDRRIRPNPNGPWYMVVGLARDVRNGREVTDDPQPEIYVVGTRPPDWREGHLALRTTASRSDADAFLRQIVTDLDPKLAVTIETVDQQVASLTERPRFVA